VSYTYPQTAFNLVFADPDMNGLEVSVLSVSSGDLMELDRLTNPQTWRELTREQQKPWMDELYTLLAQYLQSWNLTGADGAPVPTTVAGMWAQEWNLMRAIIWAWWRALIEVPSPPPHLSSGDGEPSVEASIPMEVRSQAAAAARPDEGVHE
jgi:hypothetical protein